MKGGYNMYSLIENFDYCKRVLNNLLIPYSDRVNIVVNTRSKKRWDVLQSIMQQMIIPFK